MDTEKLFLIRSFAMNDIKKFNAKGSIKPIYSKSRFYKNDLDLIQRLTMQQTTRPGDMLPREQAAVLLLRGIYEFMEAKDDGLKYVGADPEEEECSKEHINNRLHFLKEVIKNYAIFLPKNKKNIFLELCNELLTAESIYLAKTKNGGVELEPSAVKKKGTRDMQIDEILKQAESLQYNPLSIPYGGKTKIRKRCLENLNLFTASGFEHAWREAKKRKLIEVADKEKYCKSA